MEFDYCLHNMSLSCVCSLIVNYQRRERIDGDNIRRVIPQDVEKKITASMDERAQKYLAEKQVTKP